MSVFNLSYRSNDNVYQTRASLANIGHTYFGDEYLSLSELKEYFKELDGVDGFVLSRSGVKYAPVLRRGSDDFVTPDGLRLVEFKPNSTFRRVVGLGFDGANPAELFEVLQIIKREFSHLLANTDRELLNYFDQSVLVVKGSRVWLVEVPSV